MGLDTSLRTVHFINASARGTQMHGYILIGLHFSRQTTAIVWSCKERHWYQNLATGIVSSTPWQEAWLKSENDLQEKLCAMSWSNGYEKTET